MAACPIGLGRRDSDGGGGGGVEAPHQDTGKALDGYSAR